MELGARIGTMVGFSYKDKYENLVNALSAFSSGDYFEYLEVPELKNAVRYFASGLNVKHLSLPNYIGGLDQWEFSNSRTIETVSAPNMTMISASGWRNNAALTTAFFDSLTALGSSFSLAENTTLKDLYIRNKSGSELLAWTALLSRIPTSCTVHGSDADVVYDTDSATWKIVERVSANVGGGGV